MSHLLLEVATVTVVLIVNVTTIRAHPFPFLEVLRHLGLGHHAEASCDCPGRQPPRLLVSGRLQEGGSLLMFVSQAGVHMK